MNLDQAILGLSKLGYVKAEVTANDRGHWINTDLLQKGSFFFVDDQHHLEVDGLSQILIVLNQVIDGIDLSGWSLVINAWESELYDYYFIDDEVDLDYYFDDVRTPESMGDLALLIEKFRIEAINTCKQREVKNGK